MTRFLRACEGVTAVEYGILVALMTIVIIAAFSFLGQQALTQLFDKVASSL